MAISTPDPRGFPRKSPGFNNIVKGILTDEQIHKYSLLGYYGQDQKQRAEAIERTKKIAKRDAANLKRLQKRSQTGLGETPVATKGDILLDLINRGIIT